MYQMFRNQFLAFSIYQSMWTCFSPSCVDWVLVSVCVMELLVYLSGCVQFLQYYYQSGCLYRLRALGERNQLDLTVGKNLQCLIWIKSPFVSECLAWIQIQCLMFRVVFCFYCRRFSVMDVEGTHVCSSVSIFWPCEYQWFLVFFQMILHILYRYYIFYM